MTAKERRQDLLIFINEKGPHDLKSLSKKYGVSERSIRRDCDVLPLSVDDKIISYKVNRRASKGDNDKTIKTRGSSPNDSADGLGGTKASGASNAPSHNKPSPLSLTDNITNPDLNTKTQITATGRPKHVANLLTPFLQEVLDIQTQFNTKFIKCSVKDAIELRELNQKFTGMKDIPSWHRPERIINHFEWVPDITKTNRKKWKNLYHPKTEELIFEGGWDDEILDELKVDLDKLVTKQVLIINAINTPWVEIVVAQAAKRHGKTTACFVGICEAHWNGFFRKTGMWAAGEDNAKGILGDCFSDSISQDCTMPLFDAYGSSIKKKFWDGGTIQAFSNNAARTSGLDFECAYIEEAHEVVVDAPEVFDMITMTMRAKPNIKLVIAMNQGTGAYFHFERTLKEDFGKEVKFYTIENDDIIHITETADAKVRTLVSAVGGKSEVERWLDNKSMIKGSSFNPIAIENAYNAYDAFISMSNPRPAYTVLSYDPSGSGHPSGYWLGCSNIDGSEYWEIESGTYQLGDTLADIKNRIGLTDNQIKQELVNMANKYKINYFVCESNSNGKQIKQFMAMQGFKAGNQNFGDDKNKKGYSRDAMIRMVRKPMDENAMYLKGEDLYKELIVYKPEEKTTAKYKGDCADAFIHGVMWLMVKTSSEYLDKRKFSMAWVD